MKTLTLKEIKKETFPGFEVLTGIWQAENDFRTYVSRLQTNHGYTLGDRAEGKIRSSETLGYYFDPVINRGKEV